MVNKNYEFGKKINNYEELAEYVGKPIALVGNDTIMTQNGKILKTIGYAKILTAFDIPKTKDKEKQTIKAGYEILGRSTARIINQEDGVEMQCFKLDHKKPSRSNNYSLIRTLTMDELAEFQKTIKKDISKRKYEGWFNGHL